MKPHDRHLQLPELHTQLLEQRSLALLNRHELGLHQRDPFQQALLHRVDGHDRVAESGLEVALQRRLVGAEGLRIAFEDARQVVVDLQHLVLHRLEPLCLVVAGGHNLHPGRTVEVMLAHQVPDELRHLSDRHGACAIFGGDDFRRLRSRWRARAMARCSTSR